MVDDLSVREFVYSLTTEEADQLLKSETRDSEFWSRYEEWKEIQKKRGELHVV